MSEAAMLAIMVVAMASCVAVTNYSESHKAPPPPVDPVTKCVQMAWTQADRIECLKARPHGGNSK